MKQKNIAVSQSLWLIPAWLLTVVLVFGLSNCRPSVTPNAPEVKGKLFIIGGGKRGAELVNRMIKEAGLDKGGYVYILPMASELADSAVIWAGEQFLQANVQAIAASDFDSPEDMTPQRLDSVAAASLIYISGGDQRRFMEKVRNTPLQYAIYQAYRNGALIAGTSAGAAVMSEWMISGTELNYPEYNSTFLHLEHDNIELDTGMAFFKSAIIDQHFVKRSRYNRLISAIALHPDKIGIGIDESTAILVHHDSAEVIGESQVIIFAMKGSVNWSPEGKIGMKNLRLDIYLPGEKFYIGAHVP
ncbi:MAG: cyanophycinase [Cyclobacteriaceae bacterium]|nr:cyanophycinase [Cyclobacteriaceae bacterium]